MKIIILAAGKGERLWPLTRNTPKPLIEVKEGVSLLEEQLERIAKSDVVDKATIVTGYLGSMVDEMIDKLHDEHVDVTTVHNPFYNVSNNLASLWVAREELSEDCMITNGDNLFSYDVFKDFAEQCSEEGIYLSLGKKKVFDDDDMKVTLSEGNIIHVSKDIPAQHRDAESPGLCLIRGERALAKMKGAIEELILKETEINSFWLKIFTHLAANGTVVKPWYFDAENNWKEVDIHLDVDQMRELLAKMVL